MNFLACNRFLVLLKSQLLVMDLWDPKLKPHWYSVTTL
jgi:hypothetical protein